MRRGLCLAGLGLVCLFGSHHDLADAGSKKFWKHQSAGCSMPVGCHAPMGHCGMPMGCAGLGCHGPFAPLVAHYGSGCSGPGCYAPHCGGPIYGMGCAGPMCSSCSCSGSMGMGWAAPGYGQTSSFYGGFEGAVVMPQGAHQHFEGAPLLTGVPNYYAPMAPMTSPVPSIPAAEDVVW